MYIKNQSDIPAMEYYPGFNIFYMWLYNSLFSFSY